MVALKKYSSYCTNKCPVGKTQFEKFLDECESCFDAAFDMQDFVDKCSNECKYKVEKMEFDVKEG